MSPGGGFLLWMWFDGCVRIGRGMPGCRRQCAPPFSFRSCRKENGPRPVQKKRTLRRRTCAKAQVCLKRGSSESVPTKTGESSTGSRRTWAFALLCPRVYRSGRDLGVGVERTILLNSLALCLVVDGGWKRADVGIRPYRGDENSATGQPHRSAPHTVP